MTKTLTIGALVVAVLALLFFGFNSYIYNQKQQQTPIEPYRATLSGTLVCLPHKDTTGPQTLECASGLQTDAGEYYALDFNLMSETPPNIGSGERFSASGVITPVENLSSEQKYDIVGVFSVTDGVNVEISNEEPPMQSSRECFVGGCSSQLCTDEPNMASTCEYRSEYACYQSATCERQSDGECGWTETPTLRACLLHPPSI